MLQMRQREERSGSLMARLVEAERVGGGRAELLDDGDDVTFV